MKLVPDVDFISKVIARWCSGKESICQCRRSKRRGFDLLEQEMSTHSAIPAWKTPGTEQPGGWQSMGHKESDTTKRLSTDHKVVAINIGNISMRVDHPITIMVSQCSTNSPPIFLYLLTHTLDSIITNDYIYLTPKSSAYSVNSNFKLDFKWNLYFESNNSCNSLFRFSVTCIWFVDNIDL